MVKQYTLGLESGLESVLGSGSGLAGSGAVKGKGCAYLQLNIHARELSPVDSRADNTKEDNVPGTGWIRLLAMLVLRLRWLLW